MDNLTHNQRTWLNQNRDASDQINQFLAGGKASLKQTLNLETGAIGNVPVLRGVRLASQSYSEPKQALDKAEECLAQLQKLTHESTPLPERELDIDGAVLGWAESCYAQDWRCDGIHFLGSHIHQDRLPDDVAELLFNLAEHTMLHPGVKPLVDVVKDVDSDSSYSLQQEELRDLLMERGFYGFVMQLSTPLKKYHENSGSCSYTWSWYRAGAVYAESMEALFKAAEEWVAECDALDKTNSLQEAAQ